MARFDRAEQTFVGDFTGSADVEDFHCAVDLQPGGKTASEKGTIAADHCGSGARPAHFALRTIAAMAPPQNEPVPGRFVRVRYDFELPLSLIEITRNADQSPSCLVLMVVGTAWTIFHTR